MKGRKVPKTPRYQFLCFLPEVNMCFTYLLHYTTNTSFKGVLQSLPWVKLQSTTLCVITEIISHSLEILGYIYMKLTRRKHPYRLVDSCKRLSVNRMTAGLTLPKSSHGFFFSPFSTFSNTLSVTTLNRL